MRRQRDQLSREDILLGSLALAGVAGFVWLTATSRFFTATVRYGVRRREGPVEIRDYPDLVVAQTGGDAHEGHAFDRLFHYIKGESSTRQKIPMTAPVLIEKREAGSRMNFIMPDQVSPLPEPRSSRVEINVRPAARFAVLRYHTWPNRRNERKAIAILRKWLIERELPATADPIIAYYDPPWMPAPFRRNEIMIRLPVDGEDRSL